MKSQQDIVSDKFSDLVFSKREYQTFTRAERAIWCIVTIACSMDMDGFSSVYEQALTRDEIMEAIEFMKELGVEDVAMGFEQTLALLDKHNWYEMRGNDWIGVELPDEDQELFDEIGDSICDEQKLWSKQARDGLAQMLMNEKDAG